MGTYIHTEIHIYSHTVTSSQQDGYMGNEARGGGFYFIGAPMRGLYSVRAPMR